MECPVKWAMETNSVFEILVAHASLVGKTTSRSWACCPDPDTTVLVREKGTQLRIPRKDVSEKTERSLVAQNLRLISLLVGNPGDV